MAEKRRATTFRTSRGAVVYVEAPEIYIAPGMITEDITAIERGGVFNTGVLANSDFFPANLAPTRPPSTFRIYAVFSATGVLTVRRIRGIPPVPVSEQLNGGLNLNANSAYLFDIIVRSGDTINLRYSVGATIIYCLVMEVPGVIS